MTISGTTSARLSSDDPVAEQMLVFHIESLLALLGGRLEAIFRVSSLHVEVPFSCQEVFNECRPERSIA